MVAFNTCLQAQPTFKAGWNSYITRTITHEYTYDCSFKDSARLYITDSAITFAAPDSLVTMTVNYPLHEKAVYKTVYYFNPKKLLIRSEKYKGENLQKSNEWKYDVKNRPVYHYEDNKDNGNNYKQISEYNNEKDGENVITESQYFNGKIEYYTKSYYDRKGVKYKEVRLNDNNKDIIHIESYTYGENGKVKERTVYFPEFKVTKKFDEKEGSELSKCFKTMPMGVTDKINPHTRITFIKKFLSKIQPILSDKDCQEYEYTFNNGSNCELIVRTTKVNNMKQVVYRYKEKMQ